jgi:hypothetical protein
MRISDQACEWERRLGEEGHLLELGSKSSEELLLLVVVPGVAVLVLERLLAEAEDVDGEALLALDQLRRLGLGGLLLDRNSRNSRGGRLGVLLDRLGGLLSSVFDMEVGGLVVVRLSVGHLDVLGVLRLGGHGDIAIDVLSLGIFSDVVITVFSLSLVGFGRLVALLGLVVFALILIFALAFILLLALTIALALVLLERPLFLGFRLLWQDFARRDHGLLDPRADGLEELANVRPEEPGSVDWVVVLDNVDLEAQVFQTLRLGEEGKRVSGVLLDVSANLDVAQEGAKGVVEVAKKAHEDGRSLAVDGSTVQDRSRLLVDLKIVSESTTTIRQ